MRLANYGTIREASEKLYISAPALSMYINHLEKELGVIYFIEISSAFFQLILVKSTWNAAKKFWKLTRNSLYN